MKEIDGQSFLMLNLPIIQNFTSLKLGPSVKLLALVEKLKLYYFKTHAKTNNPVDDNNSEDMGFSETNNMEIDVNESNSSENDDENFSRLD